MPAKIHINHFGGIVPRTAPKLLSDVAAQRAHNCRLKSGRLEPLRGTIPDTHASRVFPVVSAATKTLHLWRRGGGEEWLAWNGLVGVANSTLNDDEHARVWVAGQTGVPRGSVANVPARILWDAEKSEGGQPGVSGMKVVSPMFKSPPSNAPVASVEWMMDVTDLNNLVGTLTQTRRVWATGWGYSEVIPPTTTSGVVSSTLLRSNRLPDSVVDMEFSMPALSRTWVFKGEYEPSLSGAGQVSDGIVRSGQELSAGIRINIIKDTVVIGQLEIMSLQGAPATHLVDTSRGSNGDLTATVTAPAYTLRIRFRECYSKVGTGGDDAGGFIWGYSAGAGDYRQYVQTYVDEYGQESPPSDVSERVFVAPGQQVTLAAITPPNSDAVKRRVYRTVVGSTQETADFRFDFEQDKVGNSFPVRVDDVDAQFLGEVLPEIENPPDDLDGLVNMPNGMLAGFRGKEVLFSEPFLPYSWPTEYRMTVDHDVVGLGVSGNDLYVLTQGFPYVISGYHPEQMIMEKLPWPQSCVSRRSIVSVNGLVWYASPDGMCAIAPGAGLRIMSEQHYTRREWQALNPATLLVGVHDAGLFLFAENASLTFQLSDGIAAVSTNDERAVALFSDVQDDVLYIVKPNAEGIFGIELWEHGAKKTFVWRSKKFQSPMPQIFNSIRVTSDAYPLTARFMASESPTNDYATPKAEQRIPRHEGVRMVRFRHERVFEVEVEHDAPIDDIVVATSMEKCRP